VIPMALINVWGSFFSRVERRNGEQTALVRLFRRGLFSRVGLNVGAPMAAPLVTPEALRERVAALMV